jgi:hypothetical protein
LAGVFDAVLLLIEAFGLAPEPSVCRAASFPGCARLRERIS